MSGPPEVDEHAARQVLEQFCVAVFEAESMHRAMTMMSPDNRREWANDWIVGELEDGRDLLKWSEREEATEALATMDVDHRLWLLFAEEALAGWQRDWAVLPEALAGRGSAILAIRRHLTMEELHALGAGWIANSPPRTGPVRVWVDFEEIDRVLHIADINIQD